MILFNSQPNLTILSESYETVLIWIFAVIMWGVIWGFATEAIVKGKGYENTKSWFFCGFFLGFIGLIIAACKPSLIAPTKVNQVPQHSTADELLKYKQLLDQGAITPEEFEAIKQQLFYQ